MHSPKSKDVKSAVLIEKLDWILERHVALLVSIGFIVGTGA